mgnify:CR=1 FL=1
MSNQTQQNKANKIDSELQIMREYINDLTDYVNDLRERAGDRMLDYFAELRQFPREVIDEQRIFYIGDATEMLLPMYLDKLENLKKSLDEKRNNVSDKQNDLKNKLNALKNNNNNRFVMPIMDIDGKILNLVGYSKEANERYVYGTAKYYRRRETMYGLENLPLAYELGYAIVTEGITDAVRLRSLGYKNTFAMCGTHKSEFIMKQLNRCRYGVLRVPDRDEAGQKAVKRWECNRHITLNTFVAYKDIDEMCSASPDNKDWVQAYINECINWLKQKEHQGLKCACENITMF